MLEWEALEFERKQKLNEFDDLKLIERLKKEKR